MLQQIKLSGNVQLDDNRLKTDGMTLVCDIGKVSAHADLPFPPNTPTLGQPWLLNSEYEITGVVDLARVIQVAPDMIQMQDQVQLVSGQATLQAIQKRPVGDGTTPPASNYQLKLGGLQANMRGTPMRWDQALQAGLDIRPAIGGQPSFKAECIAEFCNI